MNCQNLVFSQKHSQKRIEKALQVFPPLILKKILFFALYLLGAKLDAVAALLGMPAQSGKTAISRVIKGGISAFNDRRLSVNTDMIHMHPQRSLQASVLIERGYCVISFGDMDHQLKILLSNQVHLKSVLLSLLQANLLTARNVSSVLGITPAHCQGLAVKLSAADVPEVLVDKRKGHKQDIYVDQSVKAELILHFSARAITGHSTSSHELAALINKKKKTNISSRTIRWHMNKLGLMKIKKTIPELVGALKKNAKFPL